MCAPELLCCRLAHQGMFIGYNQWVILFEMKTAVFIPDPIFEEAEKLAQQRGISRSQLYTEALKKLLDEEITAQLNRVYEGLVAQSDPVLARMQALSIEPEVWEEAPKRKPAGVSRAKG